MLSQRLLKNISPYPNNSKWVSISIKKQEKTMPINRELRFLDSFRFLPSSLDKLASNLTSDKLHNLRNCYPEENEFQLLQNKGLYPYDYIDDETKLSSEQIPTKLDFYNKLKGEHISDENYNHFKHVWKVFKCKKFKDYPKTIINCI